MGNWKLAINRMSTSMKMLCNRLVALERLETTALQNSAYNFFTQCIQTWSRCRTCFCLNLNWWPNDKEWQCTKAHFCTQWLTFICYSCDGVSVQHPIQEGIRRLSNLDHRNRKDKKHVYFFRKLFFSIIPQCCFFCMSIPNTQTCDVKSSCVVFRFCLPSGKQSLSELLSKRDRQQRLLIQIYDPT